MTLVWILAALYGQYQTLPQVEGVMYGVKPVIIAVILQALWKLGQKALKNSLTWGAALAALIGYFLGWPEIALLLTLGVGVMLLGQGVKKWGQMGFFLPLLFAQTPPTPAALPGAGSVFLFFLKIGAVLYGSGYVLLAFLQRELVEQNQWLTPQQLLDAVAIGQFTPGPIFTTATFIGYLLAGNAGAVAGTIGIFLPAFILVRLTHPLAPRLRNSPWLSGFLDGVNAASLGLMAGVSFTLAQSALVDPLTVLLTITAGLVLWRWRVNSAWLVIAGGLIGLTAGGRF
jgi:chromate transporter